MEERNLDKLINSVDLKMPSIDKIRIRGEAHVEEGTANYTTGDPRVDDLVVKVFQALVDFKPVGLNELEDEVSVVLWRFVRIIVSLNHDPVRNK